jgi:hypothetical protein
MTDGDERRKSFVSKGLLVPDRLATDAARDSRKVKTPEERFSALDPDFALVFGE